MKPIVTVSDANGLVMQDETDQRMPLGGNDWRDRCRVVLRINHGALFDILDADRDERLPNRELGTAIDKRAVGNTYDDGPSRSANSISEGRGDHIRHRRAGPTGQRNR